MIRWRIEVEGRTGLEVSRMGLAAGYGISAKAVEKASHEFGVTYGSAALRVMRVISAVVPSRMGGPQKPVPELM